MSKPKNKLLIGYDLGTSSLKAVLYNLNFDIIHSSKSSYPLHSPKDGWVEQNPEDWWQAVIYCTQQLVQKVDSERDEIHSLAISAQMAGTLPVSKSGEILHPCLNWLDVRSKAMSQSITNGFPKISGYGISKLLPWLWLTNGAPSLAGKDPVSKMLWFKHKKPQIYANTYKFLDVKDYILYKLTGKFVTSNDCAHLTWLMDNRNKQAKWSPYLINKTGLDINKLPTIAQSTKLLGTLLPSAAQTLNLPESTSVANGCADINSSAIGSGQIDLGEIHLNVGTSSWLASHLDKRAVDVTTGIGTLCAAEQNKYLLIAPQELSGGCIKWATENLFNLTEEANPLDKFNQLAENSPPGARSLLFFPSLLGERVPVDDPNVRGGFANLSLHHSSNDMARAILEGIAFNILRVLPTISRYSKNHDKPIHMVGGCARSDVFCQIIADIFQRDIKSILNPELSGCLGAAKIAAVASNLTESIITDNSISKCYYPNKINTKLYQQNFELFNRHYKLIKSWNPAK